MRADLALVQAQVVELGKQMRAAAKDALVTGDTSGLQVIAGQYQAASANAARLGGQLRALGAEHQNLAKVGVSALGDLHASFTGLGGTLTKLADVIMPNLVSKAGLGVAGLALGMKEILGSASKGIVDLENLSKQSGLSIEYLQGLKKVFEENNVPVEKLNIVVGKFSEELGKARLESQKLEGQFGNPFVAADAAVRIMRGSIHGATMEMVENVRVFHGATEGIRDTSTAFKSLEMNSDFLKKYPDTVKGTQDLLTEFSRRLGLVKQGTELSRIGAEEWGRTWRVEAAGVLKIAPQIGRAIEDIRTKGLGVSSHDVELAQEYKKAVSELTDQWTRLTQEIGVSLFPLFTEMARRTEESIGYMRGTASAFFELVGSVRDALGRLATWYADTFVSNWNAATDAIKNAWTSVTDWISGKITTLLGFLQKLLDMAKSVASAVGGALGAGTGGGDPSGFTAGGFARGGMIRGPGTGTSDSILARLSDGEFVVHAAATRANFGLLQAINSGFNAPRFALGGLVDALSNIMPPGPAFASGGLVTASASAVSGGGAVHLHFPHETVAVQTDAQTLAQVGRAARQANLLSAGRKPSSIGGR
jgi:hypothetical protein